MNEIGLTCGEAVTHLLARYGVRTVFGIPGVHTLELYRGFAASGPRHVTPRHEQGAGFMADGHARVTGRPAACFVVSGPGATNIMTAMGQAMRDCVPMIVVASVNAAATNGVQEGRLHAMRDQFATLSEVAALSRRIETPGDLAPALHDAFASFATAAPGPVYIEIPLDVLAAPYPMPLSEPPPLPEPPAPDASVITQALGAIQEAERPLIVFGGGAAAYADAARALVDQLGAPVLLTINAKGLIPSDHPLLLGSLLATDAGRRCLADADLILAIGTELSETDTLAFGAYPEIPGKVIRVDIDKDRLNANATAWLACHADAGRFMMALTDRLEGPVTSDWSDYVSAVRAEFESGLSAQERQYRDLFQAILTAAPDAIIAGDSTLPIYTGNHLVDLDHPRRWFNSSTGFGTLGYALPAAMGARLAQDDRPVIAICGDGGLLFSIGEFASLQLIEKPLAILIWNNASYGAIRGFMQKDDIPLVGVDLNQCDFAAIARGFGLPSKKVHNVQDLCSTIEDHFNGGHGAIVVDIGAYELGADW